MRVRKFKPMYFLDWNRELQPLSICVTDCPANNPDLNSLTLLDMGLDNFNLTTNLVPQWAGQIGALTILNSVVFNGWTAQNSLFFIFFL
jgi:hypothetical protein